MSKEAYIRSGQDRKVVSLSRLRLDYDWMKMTGSFSVINPPQKVLFPCSSN